MEMDPHLENRVAQTGSPPSEKFQIVNGHLKVGEKLFRIRYYPKGTSGEESILNEHQEKLFLPLLEAVAANIDKKNLAGLTISARGTAYKSHPTKYTELPEAAKPYFNGLTAKAITAMAEYQPNPPASPGVFAVEQIEEVSETQDIPLDEFVIIDEPAPKPSVEEPTFREQLFKLPFILNFAAGIQIYKIKQEFGSVISDSTLKTLRNALEESPQALVDFEKAYENANLKPLIIDFLKACDALVANKNAGQYSKESKEIGRTRTELLPVIDSRTRKIFDKISVRATDLAVARTSSKNIASLSGKLIDPTILERAVINHPPEYVTSRLTDFFVLTEEIEKTQRKNEIWLESENVSRDILEDVNNLSEVILELEEVLKNVKGGNNISEALREIEHRTLNPLKKDLIQLLGEEEIDNINIALSDPP